MGEQSMGLIQGADGAARCFWSGTDPDYVLYHDHEWGRPVTDDRRLFEKICLEGFQSGLSWITILRKRENFREAFADFDFEALASHGDAEVERHLQNAGIIRHRGKIASVFNNARCAVELCEKHGNLAKWFWSFEPGEGERPDIVDHAWVRANPTSEVSTRISKELKALGWTFVGPTTIYAFMQAMGMVNDHLEGCVCRELVELERSQFKRP
ncbi:MAG: DNA-3-methyladenine glycosylase I [Rhizobiaceae bacterium]|nr:DNA-3-methyladenine glycosylase I [Rhizobiaceae bacterium]